MTIKTIIKIGVLMHVILFIIGAMFGGNDFVYPYFVCFLFLLVVILFGLGLIWVLDDDYSVYQNWDENSKVNKD